MKKYREIEESVAKSIDNIKGTNLPNDLPEWMITEGIIPGSKIIGATDIGNNSADNKTDVIVKLEESEPIKISVKMTSADYYGNWYAHKRFIHEFGVEAFNKLSIATTEWANKIMKEDTNWEKKPFVGVSVSFGKRSGKTLLPFDKILKKEDMLKIIRGERNVEHPDVEANALLVTSDVTINSPEKLINSLEELSIKNVYNHMTQFYIILRPINPQTEGTNRGKNVYTRFVPFKKLDHLTTITTMSELSKYGEFKVVEPQLGSPKLTHNFVLNDLEKKYNILIPRKSKNTK